MARMPIAPWRPVEATGVLVALANGADTAVAVISAKSYAVQLSAIGGNCMVRISQNGAPIPNPVNGALSQSAGGALAATTYYVRSTWVNVYGETLGAPETSFAVALNNVLNVAAPANPPSGATGWNVYVSTAAGTETKQNAAPIGLAAAWVEPTTGLIAGAALPSGNTTTGVAATATADIIVKAGDPPHVYACQPGDKVHAWGLGAGVSLNSCEVTH